MSHPRRRFLSARAWRPCTHDGLRVQVWRPALKKLSAGWKPQKQPANDSAKNRGFFKQQESQYITHTKSVYLSLHYITLLYFYFSHLPIGKCTIFIQKIAYRSLRLWNVHQTLLSSRKKRFSCSAYQMPCLKAQYAIYKARSLYLRQDSLLQR